jgi:catechol 2,3-dioxygenase
VDQHQLPSARIGRVHLRVSNLDRALAFYVETLGFHLVKNENGLARLSSSKSGEDLILLSENTKARPKPARTTGLYHVAVRLPNREALGSVLRRLIDRRAPLRGFADHKVSEAIYLNDLDGNGLELYTDRPRNEWPWLNEQLQMTSDPLDVQSLLDAARDESPSWNGIHPGTDIGHVHLQVSDLSRGERFYHDLLGFDITQRTYPGALFLSAGGYHHHIGLNTWTSSGAPPPLADAVGLISFAVLIPEEEALQKVTSRLAAAGIPFERGKQGGLIVRDDDQIAVDLMIEGEMGTMQS